MAFNLESISKGRAVRAPRIVLMGVEKIGKSTFASQAPDAIFIPVKGEEGADDLDVAKFPTAKSHADVMSAITTLYKEDHDYKTLVIDSASTLEPLVWDATCKREGADSIEKVGGGYGKGFTEAMTEWRQMLDGLDALRAEKNMTSIIIGHVTVKPFHDPTSDSYDTYLFDVNKRASEAILRWSDCILFCNRRVAVQKEDTGFKVKSRATGGGDPYLYTQKRAAHPGGGRGVYGQLPYELPLNWQSFASAVQSAANPAS